MISKAIVAAFGALICSETYAQANVTFSGLVDGGISYVSNQNGHGNLKFDDAIAVPNLLIISGSEDLGGGTRAVFDLRNQFSLANGGLIPGQSLFSRTALVGLDSATYGRLTLGNQYDFMFDTLFGDDAAVFAGGLYAFRAGPFQRLGLPDNPTGNYDWDRMTGERLQSSVKYVTSKFGGLSAGAMYGFGGVAGSIGANNSSSFGFSYDGGKIGVNAAYTNVKSNVSDIQVSVRNWGLGAHANLGAVTATALFTTVHNSANGASIWEVEAGALCFVKPDILLSAAYTYMKGNDALKRQHANQVAAQATYLLSTRTSVYLSGVYQRAASSGNALLSGIFDGASSTATQAVVRVGLQTKF